MSTIFKTITSATSRLNLRLLHYNRPLIEIQRTLAYSKNMETIEPVTFKIDSPEFKSILTPELETVSKMFEKYNYQLRIAGGAVRDLVRGLTPADIDFATTATPAEMKAMFAAEEIRMLNTNGEKHGTITARINDKDNFECTTLRIDIRTDGRHAEVQWTKDWQLDALRRDLTVNSMFLGLDGTVYDYFNGAEDLKNKRIRFVGSAPDRIQEDYLRILRYFRFFGRLVDDADTHEADTLQGIKENTGGLQNIAGERLWTELNKIVTGRHAGPILTVMAEVGVTPYLGFLENINLDEYRRICELSEGLNPKPTTRIAALLNTPEEMYKLNERLKFSRDELRNGLFIIEHRNDPRPDDIFRYCEDLHCDSAGKEPKTNERICELLKYFGDGETLAKCEGWKPPKLPVNGHDLLQRNVAKGPALSRTLFALRRKRKESDYTLNKEQLLDLIDEVYEAPVKKSKKSKKDTD